MKKKALLKLADYLETVKFGRDTKQFDMGKWSCGTSACAIGHAIEAGIAPNGLMLISRDEYSTIQLPYYKGFKNFDAVTEAYGLYNNGDARFMFGNVDLMKPKTVAKRIREYVSRMGD